MPDFNVRADSVKVEQIMEQVRARIRDKRGVDYTEQQIRELAAVKLEKFLDPKGVRSDLLEQFRHAQPLYTPPDPGNYAFEDQTLYESHRAPLRWIRRLLQPLLKLFFNPNPLIQALHIQSELNTTSAKRETARDQFDRLHYEVMHNLVIEATRMGIEIKNLKMRVESLTSRLEFNERRARALESVVAYDPAAGERLIEAPPPKVATGGGAPASEVAPAPEDTATAAAEGPGQRSRRRRRRRGRRGSGSAVSIMGAGTESDGDAGEAPPSGPSESAPGDQPARRPPPPPRESARAEPIDRDAPVDRGAPAGNSGSDDTGLGAGEPSGEQ